MCSQVKEDFFEGLALRLNSLPKEVRYVIIEKFFKNLEDAVNYEVGLRNSFN